jgi:hypothetical protein
MTKERALAITYSDPIAYYYCGLFIKNPAGTLNYAAYIEPLNYASWLVVLVGCLLAPLILYCTSRYFKTRLKIIPVLTHEPYTKGFFK